ncbi:phosphoenolpyruvate carboxylase [bacterium]|nr:phosphoenolpyruvate carboxylase [bacterium]
MKINTDALNERMRFLRKGLGEILGERILAQFGDKTFKLVEKIRKGFLTARRENDKTGWLKTCRDLEKLPGNKRRELITAFAVFLLVDGIVLHEGRASAKFSGIDAILDETIRGLKEDLGLSASQAQEVLKSLAIYLTLTTHPTEARPDDVIRLFDELRQVVRQILEAEDYEAKYSDCRDQAAGVIERLLATPLIRETKPEVMDEVQGQLEKFGVIYQVLPAVVQNFEQAFARHYPGEEFDVASVFEFFDWAGGDADGHDGVTAEVLEASFRARHAFIVGRYVGDLTQLAKSATMETYAKAWREYTAMFKERHRRMSGQALRVPQVRNVLEHFISRCEARLQGEPQVGWKCAGDFRAEVTELRQVLTACGFTHFAERLYDLEVRLRVFGFHLATVDIRQNSQVHENLAGQVAATFGYRFGQPYQKLNEGERRRRLHWMLCAKTGPLRIDSEELRRLEVVRWAQEWLGARACSRYIVSQTETLSDLLEVLLFLKLAGLQGTVDIVPLLETRQALENGEVIVTSMLRNRYLRPQIKSRGNRVTVMVGYSDSNKEVGFIAARHLIRETKMAIVKAAKPYKVEVVFFDGRGGSIGRSGGDPIGQAIAMVPEGITSGKTSFTVQGEAAQVFWEERSASLFLSDALSSLLVNVARLKHQGLEMHALSMEEESLLARLSERSSAAYQALVAEEGFGRFFEMVTPRELIQSWKRGSRPQKRRDLDHEQSFAEILKEVLRAIEWQIGWIQNGSYLPAIYGAGTALKELAQENLEGLQSLLEKSPHFKSLIRNLEFALLKADNWVFGMFDGLVEMDLKFGAQILEETELAKQAVLAITGNNELLQDAPDSKTRILRRKPYGDPVEALLWITLRGLRARPSARTNSRLLLDGLLCMAAIAIGQGETG